MSRTWNYLRKHHGLAWLLGVTLGLRSLWLVFGTPAALSHDELGYHEMVRQFLERGVLGYYSASPTAFVTPGYPLFVAAIYKIVALFGGGEAAQIVALRSVQMLLGVGTVALIYVLARRLLRSERGALIAGWFVALYPSSFMAQERLLTETLFTFLFALYALRMVELFDKRRLRDHASVALLLGVTTLVRPSVVPLLVLPYVVDFVSRRDRRFLAGFALTLTVWCAVMMPWWVRNCAVYERFIPLATQSGNPILRGADPWDPYDHVGPSVIEGVPEEDMSRVAMERIRQGLKEDPALWIGWFTYGKITWLWGNPWSLSPWPSRLMHWVVILLLGVPSMFAALGRAIKAAFGPQLPTAEVEALGWIATTLVVITLLQLAFIPIPRYIYPLTPLVSIFAASGVLWLVGEYGRRYGGTVG